jgi:hypothetical protein
MLIPANGFQAGKLAQRMTMNNLASGGGGGVVGLRSATRRKPAQATVASGKVSFAAPGRKQLKLSFRSKARKALSRLAKLNRKRARSHRRPISVTLTLTKRFRGADGKTVTATRKLRIKPGIRSKLR